MGDDVRKFFTLVITSCGRLELLKRTWQSFWALADMVPTSAIIVDDSGDSSVHSQIRASYSSNAILLLNPSRRGQLASIDAAYAEVKTPYIFHCEDDWLFYRSGFLAESLAILEERPDLWQVQIRELWDLNGAHPTKYIQTTSSGVLYREIDKCVHHTKGVVREWCGFSLNPGLRRKAGYDKVAPFSRFDGEHAIDRAYSAYSYRSAVLECGACSHTGGEAHIPIFEQAKVKAVIRNLVKDVVPPILFRRAKKLVSRTGE